MVEISDETYGRILWGGLPSMEKLAIRGWDATYTTDEFHTSNFATTRPWMPSWPAQYKTKGLPRPAGANDVWQYTVAHKGECAWRLRIEISSAPKKIHFNGKCFDFGKVEKKILGARHSVA